MDKAVVNIVGYPVLALDCRACVQDVVAWIKTPRGEHSVGQGRWLACLNPHSYAVAVNDKDFCVSLHKANWLIPDGTGIVLASRLLGGGIKERVTGSDIFYGVLEHLNLSEGHNVFFLGSSEDVLAEIKASMAEDYPNVHVVGTYSPPFKPVFSQQELDEMVGIVNAVAPDVLWVAMTAPKQEKWIAEVIERLDVKFVGAVGAVFDFYVGRVKRSHPAFQRMGLEWLPRLLQQPRRLWRRMFISAPIFVWHVILTRFGFRSRTIDTHTD